MTKSHTGLFIVIAFIAGLAGAWVFFSKPTDHDVVMPVKESTYDRVMRTQTIRCGYAVWSPMLMKDPNTGKFSGIFYDYIEALGDALHLNIEWTEEIGLGDFPVALNFGRIDMMCSGLWPTAGRAREIDFARPIFYQPVFLYVRADDHRFDNNLAAVNEPSTSLAYVEGSAVARIAKQDFPKAKFVELPELSDMAQALEEVVAGKADAVVQASATAMQYDLNNPGKIRRVDLEIPLRVFGASTAIAGGQDRFRRMLDITTDELIANGKIDAILQNYSQLSKAFHRVALPYQGEAAGQ